MSSVILSILMAVQYCNITTVDKPLSPSEECAYKIVSCILNTHEFLPSDQGEIFEFCRGKHESEIAEGSYE